MGKRGPTKTGGRRWQQDEKHGVTTLLKPQPGIVSECSEDAAVPVSREKTDFPRDSCAAH